MSHTSVMSVLVKALSDPTVGTIGYNRSPDAGPPYQVVLTYATRAEVVFAYDAIKGGE